MEKDYLETTMLLKIIVDFPNAVKKVQTSYLKELINYKFKTFALLFKAI